MINQRKKIAIKRNLHISFDTTPHKTVKNTIPLSLSFTPSIVILDGFDSDSYSDVVAISSFHNSESNNFSTKGTDYWIGQITSNSCVLFTLSTSGMGGVIHNIIAIE